MGGKSSKAAGQRRPSAAGSAACSRDTSSGPIWYAESTAPLVALCAAAVPAHVAPEIPADVVVRLAALLPLTAVCDETPPTHTARPLEDFPPAWPVRHLVLQALPWTFPSVTGVLQPMQLGCLDSLTFACHIELGQVTLFVENLRPVSLRHLNLQKHSMVSVANPGADSLHVLHEQCPQLTKLTCRAPSSTEAIVTETITRAGTNYPELRSLVLLTEERFVKHHAVESARSAAAAVKSGIAAAPAREPPLRVTVKAVPSAVVMAEQDAKLKKIEAQVAKIQEQSSEML